MDGVLRAAAVYFALLAVMRLSGRRTLGEMKAFDLVLVLIIGECTQQALLGDDFSVTNSIVLIVTLLAIDIGLSHVKSRFPRLERALDGVPTVLVAEGRPIDEHMRRARVDKSDIMQTARLKQGIVSMERIRFAVLEASGEISVIPYRDDE